MPLGLRCAACQKKMSVPDHAVGRRVQCPRCNYVFRYTGQRDLTLGRVRSKAPLLAAMAVSAGAVGLASARPLAPPAQPIMPDTMPLTELELLLESEDAKTMPVIDLPPLPSLPKELLARLNMPMGEAPASLDEGLESDSLEILHGGPSDEIIVPEVTEAEIEALFLEPEPPSHTEELLAYEADLDAVEEIVEAEPAKAMPYFGMPNLEIPASPAMAEEIDEIAEAMPAGDVMEITEAVEVVETLEIADAEIFDAMEAVEEIPVVEEAVEFHVAEAEEMPAEEVLDASPWLAEPVAPPMAAPIVPAAAPVMAAKVVASEMPVAAALPVAGVIRAQAVPATAMPMAMPAMSVAQAMPAQLYAPPTPPAKSANDGDDIDLEALFQDVLDQAADPVTSAPPSVAPVAAPLAEEDIDISQMFLDDDNSQPQAATAGDDIEVVEDGGFLFEDDPNQK